MKIRGFLLTADAYHTPSEKERFDVLDDWRKPVRLKFLKMVAEGALRYETVDCLCGNDVFDVLTTVDRQCMPQLTVLCVGCGLMMNNPRLDERSQNFVYSSGLYRDLYTGEKALETYDPVREEGYVKTIMAFLAERDPQFEQWPHWFRQKKGCR